MHLAAAIRRRPSETWAERIEVGKATIAYHALLLAFLLALISADVIAWPVSVAYAPVLVRAAAGVCRLSPALV